MTGTTDHLTPQEQEQARRLAWCAMSTYVRERRRITPADMECPPAGRLEELRGCFVTFRRQGALRGCIGTIQASQPLWQDLIDRAIHSATEDPRFPAVTTGEIDSLTMEISVLTPLRPVADHTDIRIGRDGILLEQGGRQAVFLPQVAGEQGWDLETTLDHLALKAGLAPGAWRSGCNFQVFQAQVF